MNDEDKLYRDADRALRAEQLLNHPLLVEAIDRQYAQYVQNWRKALKLVDREMWWHRLNALNDVHQDLKSIVNNGEFAQNVLKIRSR